MGITYEDDGLGEIEILDEEDVEFYKDLQSQNIHKRCRGCGRTVFMKPEYDVCNACADILEHGGDLSYPEVNEEENE